VEKSEKMINCTQVSQQDFKIRDLLKTYLTGDQKYSNNTINEIQAHSVHVTNWSGEKRSRRNFELHLEEKDRASFIAYQ